MLPARPPTPTPASVTSRWAISGAPAAQERSQPPLRFGRCRPGHPLACPPPGVSLEAGLPGHVRAEGICVSCWPSSSWQEDSPRPGRPRRDWAGRPPGASAGDHAALPALRRPWLSPAGTSSRSVMGWCCSRRGVRVPAHAGVCGQHPRYRDRVCTDLLAIRRHTTSYQRFLFIFNQDSPLTLFSYKFACCKQVCKDPFFGEIRVRMNTLRQGDASILRCFGANSFSRCQPLAMP